MASIFSSAPFVENPSPKRPSAIAFTRDLLLSAVRERRRDERTPSSKMSPMSAILVAIAMSLIAASILDAIPARFGGTPPVAVLVIVVFARPTPAPASTHPGNKVSQLG